MSNFDRIILCLGFGILMGAVLDKSVFFSILVGAIAVLIWFGSMILLVKAAGNE